MSLTNINGNAGDIGGYDKSSEEMKSIFDEIEQLLQNNESLEISPKAKQFQPNIHFLPGESPKKVVAGQQSPVINSIADSTNVTLDFLTTCADHEFLISVDTQAIPEEELSLYSVNQNELQPVNAPFMVPGIYKKITNAPVAASKVVTHNGNKYGTNVFFASKCGKGKIVSRNDFENSSAIKNANEYQSNNTEKLCLIEAQADSLLDMPSKALFKFASSIYKSAQNDRFVIDRKRNEICRASVVKNQNLIYRLLGPEELNLQIKFATNVTVDSMDTNRPFKLKKGRPKKLSVEEEDKQAAHKKLKLQQNVKEQEPVESVTHPLLRTRSGRVVKLVKPQSHSEASTEMSVLNSQNVKNVITDSKDKNFYGNMLTKSLTTTTDDFSSPIRSSSPLQKRRVPPESICPKCGKLFLGRRLQRHFTQHPDHMITKKPAQHTLHEVDEENMTLFRFLVSKLQKPLLNEDQRADLFLNELNDLVEQLQLRSTRLIRNTSGLHSVSGRTARILCIPEGQYALDMSAIDFETPLLDPEQHSLNGEELKRHHSIPPVEPTNPPCLDYAAISLDDTLTDEAAQKLNLSAGGKLLPPSEESLLRAVGDLVHDGITKLVSANVLHPQRTVLQSSGTSTLVPHYDHVTDNAVEALNIKESNTPQDGTPLLGLSVDFFQFKNN